MSPQTHTPLRRALVSVRRTWAEMERIQRAMLDLQPAPRRR
jgi:hypothetical protein